MYSAIIGSVEVAIRRNGGYLVMGEVQLGRGGMQIPTSQLSLSMSSTHGSNSDFSASKCFDGNLQSNCHTEGNDPIPKLTITSLFPVDKVVVYNRAECCHTWIVGATITLSAGGKQIWQKAIDSIENIYTFGGM